MAKVTASTLTNGLPLYRIELEGTRSATVLVAFNAGARAERSEENGIAHFLEHLVFKGGKKYKDYRAINDAAEGIGAVTNAYTSHDIVAFHMTARAESVPQAAEIVCDMVGQPRIDAADLERERGVVVQEIARANDQPSSIADDLIDKVAFATHPLGRTVLGPARHIKSFSRRQVVAFRKRRWGTAGAAAIIVGNTAYAKGKNVRQIFEEIPTLSGPPQFEAAPKLKSRVLTVERDTNQSHLRLLYQPRLDLTNSRQQAAFSVYATILGGSMGSRLFDEIREQRGLCYSIAAVEHMLSDMPLLFVTSGLQSNKCLEAYRRIKEIITELAQAGPTKAEFLRAKAYAAGKRILSFENTGTVARHAAKEAVVFGKRPNPDRYLSEIEKVTFNEVVEVARLVDSQPAVACVGPHSAGDLRAI